MCGIPLIFAYSRKKGARSYIRVKDLLRVLGVLLYVDALYRKIIVFNLKWKERRSM